VSITTVVVTMGSGQLAIAGLVGRESVEVRGRSCPIGYRYRPEALAQPARLEADTLYVAGGLYGNPFALQAVLERADREPGGPAAIVFNGDFHWLDIDPDDFRAISQMVLAHHATKGNVEAELASDEDAGCGCAPPTTSATTWWAAPTRSSPGCARPPVGSPSWCGVWGSCPGT
jgi:hypothetical protein